MPVHTGTTTLGQFLSLCLFGYHVVLAVHAYHGHHIMMSLYKAKSRGAKPDHDKSRIIKYLNAVGMGMKYVVTWSSLEKQNQGQVV